MSKKAYLWLMWSIWLTWIVVQDVTAQYFGWKAMGLYLLGSILYAAFIMLYANKEG